MDQQDNELSFLAGDMIEIMDMCNSDWYEGRKNDRVGYFPANRVEILPSLGMFSYIWPIYNI